MNFKNLKQVFRNLLRLVNPEYAQFVSDDLGVATWIEGGEWPCYDVRYSNFVVSNCRRSLFKSIAIIADDSDSVVRSIKSHDFSTTTHCRVHAPKDVTAGTMCCRIANQVDYHRVIIVTLSTQVAMEIAAHADNVNVCAITSTRDRLPDKGVISASSGLFMHYALCDQLLSTDLVVLNSPCHYVVASSVLVHILERLTTHTIVVLPHFGDVNQKLVDQRSFSKTIQAKAEIRVIGPSNHDTMNACPNSYIGRVKLIRKSSIDSSYRLDPVAGYRSLFYNVRTVDSMELKLLNDVTNSRHDIYTRIVRPDNKKLSQCKLYYDLMHLIMLIAIGLHDGDKRLAVMLWDNNAMPSPKVVESLPLCLAPYKIDAKSGLVVGYDHGASCDWIFGSYQYPYGTTAITALCESKSCAAESQVKSINGKYTVMATTSKIWSADNLAFVSVVDVSVTKVTLRHDGTISYRDLPEFDKCMSNFTLLNLIWHAYSCTLSNSDQLYISQLPFVDVRQVTPLSKEDARQVLANNALPSYSEIELHSVLALWNEYVARNRRKPIINFKRVKLFVDYFVERGLYFEY